MKRTGLLALGLLLSLLMAGSARAQKHPAEGLGSPLAGLFAQRDGVMKHEGSWDRSGGNGDMRGVAPGQTITLLDYTGAGIIRRFWVTIAPRADVSIHRQTILRMYWDDEPMPSVEVPIGDFFGVGFGEQKDYISLPLNETSGGYNCYWPMPFHKRARWTLTNLSKKRIDAFYYNIDFIAYKKLPKECLHFHAQWRRENPTRPGQNYTLLEATGRGHFVGAALFMQNRRGRDLGFLEGDEMIYFDGEAKPSFIGTGTEDYFSSGWYFDRGLYSAPFHGVTLLDARLGRVCAYRWHIEDAMPFQKSIKVTIEHGHNNEYEGDYSSVAFWYQTEPHAPFPVLPANPDHLLAYVPPPPRQFPGAIEGESLRTAALVSEGPLEEQVMVPFSGEWSGAAQLWWRPTLPGATLILLLPAPEEGDYELIGHFTKAKDYATVQITQNGQNIGSEVNLYDPNVVPSGAISLGKITLKKGANPLQITVKGKDERSTGYLVGLDAFVLKRL
jgi:hypothetical protein